MAKREMAGVLAFGLAIYGIIDSGKDSSGNPKYDYDWTPAPAAEQVYDENGNFVDVDIVGAGEGLDNSAQDCTSTYEDFLRLRDVLRTQYEGVVLRPNQELGIPNVPDIEIDCRG